MFRVGMVSVKAENVHYTNYTVPAAQVLFTQVRPFRRAAFFYEPEEAVEADQLRRAQDELKVIFDAVRREETANALAEQIREEMKRWHEHAERVMIELRPAGYPIPETVQASQDLHFRVTRFANPGKIVNMFLENLEEVRAWHSEVQTLHGFIRNKRLPLFQRAQNLLDEIDRATGVPGTEPLAEEDARQWRERLTRLATSGQAAHKWSEFTSASTPLQERFQTVYRSLHTERDQVVSGAKERLQQVGAPANSLLAYECQDLSWAEDGLHCARCNAPLKELYLQTVALPNLVREFQERYETQTQYGKDGPRVKRLRVAQVVPKSRIENDDELSEALAVLRRAVTEALVEADAVELE